MTSKSDSEHLRYAAQEKRILISFNVEDYYPLAQRQRHAGIIVSPQLPLDAYDALAQRIVDKLTLVQEWTDVLVWA